MTSGDTQAWRVLYGKLCAIYDRVFDEAQSRFYFDALQECDVRDLEIAAVDLARSSKWFPRPAEWRAQVLTRRCELRRQRDLTLVQQRPTPTIHCAACRDTGMRGEERLSPCPCRGTNPNYQRTQAMSRLAAGTSDPPPAEAQRLTDQIRDFKQLQSGGE